MSDCFCLCAVLLGLLILTLAGCIFYSGLLADVTVKTCCPAFNKLTFAYKFKEGAYKDSGELLKEARCVGLGLPCLGVFYEDPKKISAPLCRYAVGCILSEGENKVDEELLEQCKSSGFSVFSFPKVTHVISTSFRHTALFSTYFRVRRVYPQLERYIKERRLCAHPFLELYRDGQIQFIVPLARQGDFYVPEVRQAERRLSEQEEFHSDTDISANTVLGAAFCCQTAERPHRRRPPSALCPSKIKGVETTKGEALGEPSLKNRSGSGVAESRKGEDNMEGPKRRTWRSPRRSCGVSLERRSKDSVRPIS